MKATSYQDDWLSKQPVIEVADYQGSQIMNHEFKCFDNRFAAYWDTPVNLG